MILHKNDPRAQRGIGIRRQQAQGLFKKMRQSFVIGRQKSHTFAFREVQTLVHDFQYAGVFCLTDEFDVRVPGNQLPDCRDAIISRRVVDDDDSRALDRLGEDRSQLITDQVAVVEVRDDHG